MMIGSMYPERIESMFLMSPAGTNSYNSETYEKYGFVSMQGESWRLAVGKEADEQIKDRDNNVHPL